MQMMYNGPGSIFLIEFAMTTPLGSRLEFKKAFDSIPHDILFKKLNCELRVNGSLLDLICNYLSGRLRTIYCAKWCKVRFVTCINGDPTKFGFRSDCSCYSRTTYLLLCPLGPYICMRMIPPYTVLEKQRF